MRKLILQSQISLDAFMAARDGSTDWMVWNWGPDWTWDANLQKYHADVILSAETVLLPGKTPEMFIEHWREVAKDEDGPMYAFAHHLGHGEKVVFSRKERDVPWENTSLISGDLAAEVAGLKARPGGDIIAFGGSSFAGALLAEGLVDVMHLFVNPVALGEGMPLFNQLRSPLSLDLVDTYSFGDGMKTVQYKVVPPGPSA